MRVCRITWGGGRSGCDREPARWTGTRARLYRPSERTAGRVGPKSIHRLAKPINRTGGQMDVGSLTRDERKVVGRRIDPETAEVMACYAWFDDLYFESTLARAMKMHCWGVSTTQGTRLSGFGSTSSTFQKKPAPVSGSRRTPTISGSEHRSCSFKTEGAVGVQDALNPSPMLGQQTGGAFDIPGDGCNDRTGVR